MDLTSCTASITSWTAVVRVTLGLLYLIKSCFFKFQGEDLTDLEPLTGHGSIQRIDVSDNRIISLHECALFPQLSWVNASNNCLSAALDFQTQIADDHGEVHNISNSQSSQVSYADLSSNQIKRLRELEGHKRLVTLILAHNQISSVIGLSHLTRLQKLDLRFNKLTSMFGIGKLPALRELLLDGNDIQRISGLEDLPALNTLSLRENKLQDVDGVQDAPRLVTLDVSGNRMDDIYAIEPAMSLPFLGYLSVADNPLCMRLRHLNLRIIHRLPGLGSLDGTEVTAEVKVNAANLHGADVSDRRRIFHRVLPDQMFTDPTILIDPSEDARRSSEAALDRLAQRLTGDALEAGSRDAAATHSSAMGAAVFRSNTNSPSGSRAHTASDALPVAKR